MRKDVRPTGMSRPHHACDSPAPPLVIIGRERLECARDIVYRRRMDDGLSVREIRMRREPVVGDEDRRKWARRGGAVTGECISDERGKIRVV